MATTQSTLRKWLAEGEMERTVDELVKIAEARGDKYFRQDVNHQAGRFNDLERQYLNGVLEDSFYNIQRNKISLALQDLIDRVGEGGDGGGVSVGVDLDRNKDGVGVDSDTDEESMSVDLDQTQTQTTPSSPPAQTQTTPTPLLIGLLLLLGTAIALLVFIPCPTEPQLGIFRLLMAVGAGGVASILPGYIQFESRGVKAGSSFGAFALVYLINPAGLLSDARPCDPGVPFEFTVRLETAEGMEVSEHYPRLEGTDLAVFLDNKWESTRIDQDNLADFKSIPSKFQEIKVPVRLQDRYWQLNRKTINLIDKSQVLEIEPTGLLGQVRGRIKTLDGQPLPKATIRIGTQTATSDQDGTFSLNIPTIEQQRRYVYTAEKPGYTTITQPFEVDGGQIEIRLTKAE